MTGISATIFTKMLGKGEMKIKGVIPPEGLTQEIRETFLVRLAEKGFVYNEIVERLA